MLEIVYMEVTMEVMCAYITLLIILKIYPKMGSFILCKIYLNIGN